MSTLLDTLQQQLDALHRAGYEVMPLVFEPPASLPEIAELEHELGYPLPLSFRSVLLNVSRHVEFAWFKPRTAAYPEPFQTLFRGDLHWSLELLLELDEEKSGWIRSVFSDRDDPYDAVWHDKLAVQDVGNGDYLALDLSPSSLGQVVYLSHDEGEGHGFILAEDFGQLIDRWVPLGCPGAEDWQWLPFCSGIGGRINPHGAHAVAWRRIIGLEA